MIDRVVSHEPSSDIQRVQSCLVWAVKESNCSARNFWPWKVHIRMAKGFSCILFLEGVSERVVEPKASVPIVFLNYRWLSLAVLTMETRQLISMREICCGKWVQRGVNLLFDPVDMIHINRMALRWLWTGWAWMGSCYRCLRNTAMDSGVRGRWNDFTP